MPSISSLDVKQNALASFEDPGGREYLPPPIGGGGDPGRTPPVFYKRKEAQGTVGVKWLVRSSTLGGVGTFFKINLRFAPSVWDQTNYHLFMNMAWGGAC